MIRIITQDSGLTKSAKDGMLAHNEISQNAYPVLIDLFTDDIIRATAEDVTIKPYSRAENCGIFRLIIL